MHNPWLQMMQAMVPQAGAPNLCAPQKASLAPFWAMAMDPRRNPWLAMGLAFGPMAWATALQALHAAPPRDEAEVAAATEQLVEDMPV